MLRLRLQDQYSAAGEVAGESTNHQLVSDDSRYGAVVECLRKLGRRHSEPSRRAEAAKCNLGVVGLGVEFADGGPEVVSWGAWNVSFGFLTNTIGQLGAGIEDVGSLLVSDGSTEGGDARINAGFQGNEV